MERERIMGFVEFCKNHILENIENYEGQSVYACDLGYTLTEGMNVDGTFTYSTDLAKDYLHEWWYEAADYWEYEKSNFGENYHNPFDNPEAYIVCMVIEGVNGLLARCDYIDKHWNDEIKLTKRAIATITKQVEELSEETEVF